MSSKNKKNYNQIFTSRLKEIMKEHDEMTPTELARVLKCDIHAVSRWLHESNFPRFSTLLKITDHFKITIDFLLGLSDDETFDRVATTSKFLERLSLLLKGQNLSKYQLAKELKIEQATISKWFAGSYMPETFYLIKLSNYFEVTIEYLLGFNDSNIYQKPFSF